MKLSTPYISEKTISSDITQQILVLAVIGVISAVMFAFTKEK